MVEAEDSSILIPSNTDYWSVSFTRILLCTSTPNCTSTNTNFLRFKLTVLWPRI